MSCGCRGRPKPPPEVDYVPCEFDDSGVLGSQYWPRRQMHSLSLAAGNVYPVLTLSDVVQTMYVTVVSGVAYFWFLSSGGNPTVSGDQPHMVFSTTNRPVEIVLPPGEHRMQFGAANSEALVCSVVVMDREAHRGRG